MKARHYYYFMLAKTQVLFFRLLLKYFLRSANYTQSYEIFRFIKKEEKGILDAIYIVICSVLQPSIRALVWSLSIFSAYRLMHFTRHEESIMFGGSPIAPDNASSPVVNSSIHYARHLDCVLFIDYFLPGAAQLHRLCPPHDLLSR